MPAWQNSTGPATGRASSWRGARTEALSVRCSRLLQHLPDEVELALFRIVQQALSNVEQHAGATSVKIALRQEETSICVEIKDNGQGFDLQHCSAGDRRRHGLGLD